MYKHNPKLLDVCTCGLNAAQTEVKQRGNLGKLSIPDASFQGPCQRLTCLIVCALAKPVQSPYLDLRAGSTCSLMHVHVPTYSAAMQSMLKIVLKFSN